MLINSQLNNKKYFWVKVPRTGTAAYAQLFNPELASGKYLHMHVKYTNTMSCECNGIHTHVINENGVAVVRNPLTRFISSLHYLKKASITNIETSTRSLPLNMMCVVCGNVTPLPPSINQSRNFFEFYKDEKTFYEFFYDNFEKNCVVKSGDNLEDVFKTENPMLVTSFFYTQVHWAYYPNVKIFKYENIEEFNSWITTELGYDVSTLKKINVSEKVHIPIDFTTDKFKRLVKHLFYDDFRYFNYDFPI